MKLDEYQDMIIKYDCSDYKKWQKKMDVRDAAFMEKVLGLVGEAGEAVDKIKKIVRDKDGKLAPGDRIEIEKELGDTLWYVAVIAKYLGMPLSEVAIVNVGKLASRHERGKIHGEGDNR